MQFFEKKNAKLKCSEVFLPRNFHAIKCKFISDLRKNYIDPRNPRRDISDPRDPRNLRGHATHAI